jgi:hypothetical protein
MDARQSALQQVVEFEAGQMAEHVRKTEDDKLGCSSPDAMMRELSKAISRVDQTRCTTKPLTTTLHPAIFEE